MVYLTRSFFRCLVHYFTLFSYFLGWICLDWCSLPDLTSIMVPRALVLIFTNTRLLYFLLLGGALNIRNYIWVCFVNLRRAGDRALLLPESIIDDRIRGLWNWHGSLLLCLGIFIVTDFGVVVFLYCQSFSTVVLRFNFFFFDSLHTGSILSLSFLSHAIDLSLTKFIEGSLIFL